MSDNPVNSTGKIYAAIPAIMKDMNAVGKNQNCENKFMFRGIDDVYNSLQKIMAKHGVFTVARIVDSL